MTKNNKKKKTAREKRILVGAFLTAVVIAAGSTFAWFTSSDTVTNRLSANADYNVAIAESFSPPKNWLPGQKVDKDVYAVNTGNIDAFVKASISGRLSVTREEPVTSATWNTAEGTKGTVDNFASLGDLITLDEKEYYSMEAGSYLAYKPDGDTVNKLLGNKIVMMTAKDENGNVTGYDAVNAYTYTVKQGDTDIGDAFVSPTGENTFTLSVTTDSGGNPTTVTGSGEFTGDSNEATVTIGEAPNAKTYTVTRTAGIGTGNNSYKTDFTPAAEGLYVFRRAIGVNEQGYETFDYAGYYYKDGVYYKVMNLAVTSDTINDKMNDGDESDGQLVNATADFVKEVSEVKDPVDMTYEPGNHRLVVKYNSTNAEAYDANWNRDTNQANDPDMDVLAADLDEALHNLAKAQAALDRAGIDYDSYQAQFAKYSTLKAQYEKMKADYETEKAQLTTAKAAVDTNATNEHNLQTSTAGDSNSTGGNTAYESLTSIFGDGKATLVTGDLAGTNNGGYTGQFKLGGENGTSYTVDDFVDALDAEGSTITGTDGLLKTYTDAKTAFGLLNPPMDNQYIKDYMKELLNTYKADVEFDDEENLLLRAESNTLTAADYNTIINALTYTQLTTTTPPAYNPNSDDEGHVYYKKFTAMKQAREALDTALATLEGQLNTLKTTSDNLGKAGGTEGLTPATYYTVDGAENSPFTAAGEETYKPVTEGTGDDATTPYVGTYLDEQADLAAQINTLNARIDALTRAIEAANTKAEESKKAPNETNTADDNQTAAINAYNTAYTAYEKALAAYNKGQDRAEYESELVIYINLLNDIENGGIGEKWQILPKTLVDTDNNTAGDTAVFYYTSILQRGQISKQLVDNIELANTVTQETYKSFEFDINVELESAQITYADDNVTIKPDAANETFDYEVGNTKHDITATLTDNQKIDTAITWTDTP